MANMDKLTEYMQKYTRDFVVFDQPGIKSLHEGMLNQFDIVIEPGQIIASYKYPDGEIGVFQGGEIRFDMHGEKCVLLTESLGYGKHSGDDLIVFYKNGYENSASGCASVSYGTKYVRI